MEESLGDKEKKHIPDLHPLLDASHSFLMFFRITVQSNSNLSLPHTFLFGGRHWRAKGRVVSNSSIVVSSHLWILKVHLFGHGRCLYGCWFVLGLVEVTFMC